MNKKQKILLKLLNCSIRKEKLLLLNCKKINWNYIIAESKEHDIYPLLYPIIKDIPHPQVITAALKEKWKLDAFSTAIYFNRQIKQMGKVFKAFNVEAIPVIALKGLILRNFFPVPDLRTMGDADILIHKEDIERVVTLLTGMDYIQTKDSTPAHITFVHGYYSPVEVHWTLADTRYIDNISQFEREIWKRAVTKTIDGSTVLCLHPEDFLMHLCIHMAVHMRSGGFGLRQLCDFVLFLENEGTVILWEIFNIKIKQSGIEKFIIAIFNVCNEIFNLQLPKGLINLSIDKKYIQMLINDIFESGVFGMKTLDRVFGNTLLNADIIFKNENYPKMNSVINIICPPVNTLSDTYSYAKKHKLLAPLAWLHRFFAGTVNDEYNVFNKLNFLFFSTFTFKKRSKLIKSLEL